MDKSCYLFRYLLLAKVLEVGVVEVHEGVLEGSDQHGTKLKLFLFQIAHAKWIKCWYQFRYLLLAEVTQVGFVGVAKGVHDGLEAQFPKNS